MKPCAKFEYNIRTRTFYSLITQTRSLLVLLSHVDIQHHLAKLVSRWYLVKQVLNKNPASYPPGPRVAPCWGHASNQALVHLCGVGQEV